MTFPPKAADGAADVLMALPPRAGVAVIRLRSLGDTLLSTPAIAALKRWRPDLRIAYVVEPQFASVLDRNPDVSQIVSFPRSIAGRAIALRRLRAFRPDLAIGLHGSRTAAWMARLSGAPERATFLGLHHAWAYTRLAPAVAPGPPRRRLHTVEHVVSLLHFLGLPEVEIGPVRLDPSNAARARVQERLLQAGVRAPFAFFNMFPRSFTMQWSPGLYRELARWLFASYGIRAVAARADARTPGSDDIVALSGTSIEDLVALVAEANLFVGSDGGPLHIAAALGKPTVAIFSSTDAEVWAPWRTRSRLVQNSYPCNPCRADRCYQFVQPECILSVRLEQVQRAVEELMGSRLEPITPPP